MNNIEVEMKVPLDPESFERCKRYLEVHAVFKAETAQSDEYFAPQHRDFLSPEFPFEWLSVRQRGDACSLNYKHWYPENVLESTHCDEYDIKVSSADKLRLLLKALDIRSLVKVDKLRRTYVLEGCFEIALDAIADLGAFIEIEFIGDATIEEANAGLQRIASALQLPSEHRDHRGYPYLMLEKAGLLGGSHDS